MSNVLTLILQNLTQTALRAETFRGTHGVHLREDLALA
jgi:hypothetical protein